jgi:hypothetical protein
MNPARLQWLRLRCGEELAQAVSGSGQGCVLERSKLTRRALHGGSRPHVRNKAGSKRLRSSAAITALRRLHAKGANREFRQASPPAPPAAAEPRSRNRADLCKSTPLRCTTSANCSCELKSGACVLVPRCADP